MIKVIELFISCRRQVVVTNRCEVVCLDINGFANGNDDLSRIKHLILDLKVCLMS